MSYTGYPEKIKCKLAVLTNLTYDKEYEVNRIDGAFIDDKGCMCYLGDMWKCFDYNF